MITEANPLEPTENSIEDDQPKQLTFELLKSIKDAQQQHGLRHGDYQRYRGYCSRRIRRLRKVLKLPQGDRRHFKRRDVTEVHITNPRADERWLHLPLMLAERNWAYAMQLRQEANTEPRKKFHLVQKLRKACVNALQLEELCKLERCDARTKLEAQAYVAWIHGTLHFELQLWSKATENFKKAQVIYEKLASAVSEEDQLPYKQRVEEIAPSLRYCAYNIGDEKAVDLLELRSQGVLENLDELISQNKGKVATVFEEIEWFGLKVPVKIERVRLFLLSIKGLDESLKHSDNIQDKIKILENMFIDLRDIVALTRDEAKNDANNQLLLTYLISIRTKRTLQRNLLLIQQTRKAQDCVRLLDINIQQLTELKQNDHLIQDQKAQKQFETELSAFRAIKSYYSAKAHMNSKRWREAVSLLNTCRSYAPPTGHDFLPELTTLIETMTTNVEPDILLCRANYATEVEQEAEVPLLPTKHYKSKKPLIERLDEFREEPQLLTKNPNIVSLPKMEAVPVKPLFFDLALNHIEMPSLKGKLEDGGNKQGAGLSGFVKGLWGWGKK